MKYIKFPFYNYIIIEDSITKKKDRTKNGIDLVNTCYELEKIYEEIDDVELKRLLNDYLVMLFLNAINFGNLYSKKYRNIYDPTFLIGKATSRRNIVKSKLFLFNKKIYKILNSLSKI